MLLLFIIYSPGGHLGNVTWTIFLFPIPTDVPHKVCFGFDWPWGFKGEDV